jgi:hypothetical protein
MFTFGLVRRAAQPYGMTCQALVLMRVLPAPHGSRAAAKWARACARKTGPNPPLGLRTAGRSM